jgi:hypothetical protein
MRLLERLRNAERLRFALVAGILVLVMASLRVAGQIFETVDVNIVN